MNTPQNTVVMATLQLRDLSIDLCYWFQLKKEINSFHEINYFMKKENTKGSELLLLINIPVFRQGIVSFCTKMINFNL